MPPRRQAKRRTCLCPSGFRPPPRMRHNANTSPLPISRRAKAPALPQITAQANKCTRRENGLTAAAKQSLALCSPTVPLLSRRTVARSIKQAQNASRAGGIRRSRVLLHIRRCEARPPLPPENRRAKAPALPRKTVRRQSDARGSGASAAKVQRYRPGVIPPTPGAPTRGPTANAPHCGLPLFDFLLQFIELLGAEKLPERDFQTVAQLFDRTHRDVLSGVVEQAVHG